MSTLHGFVSAAKALISQAVVSRVVGLATSAVLARGLGPHAFGQYSAAMNIASSMYAVVRVGVDAAVHVDVARGTASNDATLGATLAAGLLFLASAAIVAVCGSYVLQDWIASQVFWAPELAPFIVLAGFLAAFQCLIQFAYPVLAGLNLFPAYARLLAANSVVNLVFAAAGMLGWGAVGALVGTLAASASFALALLGHALREIKSRGLKLDFRNAGAAMLPLLRFGMPHYMSSLVSVPVFLYLQGLLSKSMGLDALAMYRVIETFVALIMFVPTTTSAALTTALARRHSNDAFGLWDKGILGVKITAMAGLFAAIALATLLAQCVAVFFGVTYLAADTPGVVALFSACLSGVVVTFSSLFQALRRSDLILGQVLVGALVMLVLGSYLIPSHGLLGYFLAGFAGNAAAVVVLVVATSRFVERAKALRVATMMASLGVILCAAIATFLVLGRDYLAGSVIAVFAAGLLFATRTRWLSEPEITAVGSLWRALTTRAQH